ncbi:pentatricopeptide repeat-containing protein At4g02750 [Selaginella moellendorffii]|uniref:pentatricopeptide repeat-containing protein At4g02750 n=1 Tax=Selaginella moellendorffii TaxID=88036 RepID=UPI000D1C303C|nr:pentatricopeptide repeat-containing protein At4g02750 [Selaginella moellendorffii]|eukprot:XP_024530202.1 pentatricopeptide repeat-containing protein At4g02750 [Selaginella moellendorffii]
MSKILAEVWKTKNSAIELQFSALLGSCRDLATGRRIHAQILAGGGAPTRFLSNLIVQMYGKCGSVADAELAFRSIRDPNLFSHSMIISAYIHNGQLDQARAMFSSFHNRDVVLWNTMLQGYARTGDIVEATKLFQDIPSKDAVSWSEVVQAHAHAGDLCSARQILDKMPLWNTGSWTAMLVANAQAGHLDQTWFCFVGIRFLDIVACNAMLQAFTNSGEYFKAFELFFKIPKHNVVSCTTMLAAYAQKGHSLELKQFFQDMLCRTPITWNAMVNCCKLNDAKETAKRMPAHDVMTWTSLNEHPSEAMDLFLAAPLREIVTWNHMIVAMGQNGEIEQARLVFDRLPARDVVSWSSITAALAHNGSIQEARALFDHHTPERNLVSWNAMVAAYGQSGDATLAKAVFDRSPGWNTLSWNSILVALAGNGLVDRAREMFDGFPGSRNLVSWSAMIQAYALHARGDLALGLLREMDVEGIEADESTLLGVLALCGHLGMLREGVEMFRCLASDRWMEPGGEHYSCMVSLLGRVGMVEAAEELVRAMPFMPGVAAWTSVLNACRTHDQVEVAERMCEDALEAFPDCPSPYSLLANVLSRGICKGAASATFRRRSDQFMKQ